MPQVNIYIRDEDYLAWIKIEKKSEWMHQALSGTVIKKPAKKTVDMTHEDFRALAEPDILQDTDGPVLTPKALSWKDDGFFDKPAGVCKIHGIPLDAKGKCLQKGCKYAVS